MDGQAGGDGVSLVVVSIVASLVATVARLDVAVA